jgi:Holliday junction resolvasome RuvABC ATP-dependent DNA helicase subunit
MKTHKQVKIIGLVDGGQNIVKCIATKDIATFPLGEALRSNKFDGHAAGSYVQVTVRCSDRYRFILGVVEASNEVLADYKTDDTTWAADHYAVIFGEELVAKANEIAAAHQGIVAALAQKVEKMAQAERPYFYISPEHKKVSGFSMNMLKKNPNRPVKVLVYGESGYGKTSLAQQIAYEAQMDCFRMNCALVRDPEEWFGQRSAKEGTTYFEKSEFIKRVEGGNCVIILDEFNRMEPWVGNSLYPLLDDDASTTIMNEVIKVGPNILFYATINLGFEYTGTFTVDAAMSNRFNFFMEVGEYDKTIEMSIISKRFPDIKNSTTIESIVDIGRAIRRLKLVGCTLRTLIQVAEAVDAGAGVREAWQHVFVYRCPQDGSTNIRKEIIDLLNSRLGTV